MSKLSQLNFFDQNYSIVIADNHTLPQLDGSNLFNIVKSVNNKVGNVKIKSSSDFIKVNNTLQGIISIGLNVPNLKSLFLQLDGQDVINTQKNYQIIYDNTNYNITIVHNFGGKVVGIVFDENYKQAFYGIDYIDDNKVRIQFDQQNFPNTTNIWRISLGIGGMLQGSNSSVDIDEELPNENSTLTKVPSSYSVYTFVTQQIDELQSNIQENFDVINSFNQNTIQNISELQTNIENINQRLIQIDQFLGDMSELLDEINGNKQ